MLGRLKRMFEPKPPKVAIEEHGQNPLSSASGSEMPTSRSRPTYTPMPYPAGRNRPPTPSRRRCRTEGEHRDRTDRISNATTER